VRALFDVPGVPDGAYGPAGEADGPDSANTPVAEDVP
jgi:hypothetical protein